MCSESLVVAKGVSHVFRSGGASREVNALGLIDFSLRAGEFFSIVGPSGCGKSTLLDIVAGLTRPTGGAVFFEGKEVGDTIPEGIGIVFQDDASFPWLTVRQNIGFGLKHRGADQQTVARSVDRALSLMGLQNFAEAYPAQLSGGMRQRVCIARTLVLEPRLILLDEPFGALDQQTRLLMGDELLRLWRETGATVLLITHALDEAAMLSDRIGIMSARPGRFLDCIKTDWPRDRTSKIVADPSFGNITSHIWATLREESMKSIGEMRNAGT